MESGIDFLRDRLQNALADHHDFLQTLTDEEAQANDDRVRDLCARFIGVAREHQRLLDEVTSLLASGSQDRGSSLRDDVEAVARRAVGAAVGTARALADAAPPGDFDRLVDLAHKADVVEADFRTFREAGRALGIVPLARIGELAERHHDAFARDAYRLVQQMFVERARGAEHAIGVGRLASRDLPR